MFLLQVVDISGMEPLKEALYNCTRTDTVRNCGHVINLEKPRYLGALIMAHHDGTKEGLAIPSAKI